MKLSEIQNQLTETGFSLKKVKSIVAKSNLDVYAAYHEDGEDTWRHGWSSDDYREEGNDVLIFEAKKLIQKKKPTLQFHKAHTYTAECVIFVFAKLHEVLADEILKEKFLKSKKAQSDKYAASDYSRATETKQAIEKYQELPEATRLEIEALTEEMYGNLGKPNSRRRREEIEKRIGELGGHNPMPQLVDWQIFALKFDALEKYQTFKWAEKLEKLLSVETTS